MKNYRVEILKEILSNMQKDDYYLCKVKGNDTKAINLNEGAVNLLIEYYSIEFYNMEKYYNGYTGNYIIPITEYTKEIENEVKEFLKVNRDYFLMYLSIDDGYDEDAWCITNYLE